MATRRKDRLPIKLPVRSPVPRQVTLLEPQDADTTMANAKVRKSHKPTEDQQSTLITLESVYTRAVGSTARAGWSQGFGTAALNVCQALPHTLGINDLTEWTGLFTPLWPLLLKQARHVPALSTHLELSSPQYPPPSSLTSVHLLCEGCQVKRPPMSSSLFPTAFSLLRFLLSTFITF